MLISRNDKAMTLTELLVSTVLIGIVLLGIISFSAAIKQIQDSTSRVGLLAMRTTALMNEMAKNASLAVGFRDDPGIFFDNDLTDNRVWLSIRQDQNQPTTTDTYADDTWVIYVYDALQHILSTCTHTIEGGYAPGSSCQDRIISQEVVDAQFNFVADSDNYRFYVDIKLTTAYNPGNFSSNDPRADLVNNPVYTLETKVSPAAHSW